MTEQIACRASAARVDRRQVATPLKELGLQTPWGRTAAEETAGTSERERGLREGIDTHLGVVNHCSLSR